jgi:hypothetical protein
MTRPRTGIPLRDCVNFGYAAGWKKFEPLWDFKKF